MVRATPFQEQEGNKDRLECDFMGEWKLRELNKVDRPFQLLFWFEHGRDHMNVKKIRVDSQMSVGVRHEIDRIFKLPEGRREKELAGLPYKIESDIAKKLKVKGSLPYEIRDWVSTVIREVLRE
jgi:hypothetical protein